MLKLTGEIIKLEKGGTGHPELKGTWADEGQSYRVVTVSFGSAGLFTLRVTVAAGAKLKIGDKFVVTCNHLDKSAKLAVIDPSKAYTVSLDWPQKFSVKRKVKHK